MDDEQDDTAGSKIDLSSVPEPMRSMLLKQLAKIPAPMRERLLREGSPMLERVIAKARQGAIATKALPPAAAIRSALGATHNQPRHDEPVRPGSVASVPNRVPTVSPGDSTNGGLWLLAFFVALAVACYFALRG